MDHYIKGREAFHYLAQEVSSLVAYEFNWAPEPTPDVLVEEFGCRGGDIVLEWFGLYPLCIVVGGDEDVFVARARCGWGE